jgi:hypothetical protein
MILIGKSLYIGRETCPATALSTMNPTWIGLVSSPVFPFEMSAISKPGLLKNNKEKFD